MPYISEENRLTLRDIKRIHGLSNVAVAAIACINVSKVYNMECGGYLSEKDIDLILGTLSRVTGKSYNRDTVGGYWTGKDEVAF